MSLNFECREFSEFAPVVGIQFIEDVTRTLINDASLDPQFLRGLRIFLDYLDRKEDVNARRLLRGLRDHKSREASSSNLLAAQLNEWIEWELRECRYSRDYLRRLQHTTAFAFATLSDLQESRYPYFQRSFVRWKHLPPDRDKATLGRRPWAGLGGLTGVARERAALELFRDNITTTFTDSAVFTEIGQSIALRETNRDAEFDDLRRAIDLEISCLARGDRYKKGPHGSFIHNGLDPAVIRRLRNPAYWTRFGLRGHILRDQPRALSYPEVGFLIRSCVAPNRELSYSLGLTTCCHIGWNKQPIFSLPRELYFFKTEDDFALASERWIASFKERAGHEVVGYLARSELAGGRLDAVNKLWRETDADIGQNGPESTTIERDHVLVDLFDRYDRICSNYRSMTSTDPFPDDFFLNVTSSGPTRAFRPPNYWTHEYLIGTNFDEIRGSVAKIGIREVGSIEGLRAEMGHKGTGVLYPYYVGDPELQRAQLESFRFYQNCSEALFLAGKLNSVKINIPDTNIHWFYNLAHVSGLSAVFGLHEAPQQGSAVKRPLNFFPTDQNLEDLYIVFIELKRQRRLLERRRWYIQGRPQLAVAKALITTVLEGGLATAYGRAVKKAYGRLRRGEILRPVLF
ncbi:hypothetical protein [Rhizobium laguerreae]|uniref:hypothetical protein n=1 Tax=Rhizobium laguerreae TaxID=1076926 RepID=UPI001C90A4F2|nr:hypothetical protein [Rhizobium laguerreae]MBY3556453.1 hypothetical protein [Rhizobium laguerreae]